MKKKVFPFTLSVVQDKWLQKEADKKGTTKADIARRLIEAAMNKEAYK